MAAPFVPADRTDPPSLPADRRLDELAALLAAGLRRWLAARVPAATPTVHAANPGEEVSR